jgi:X-X-X-Leu-X-X-Gly heptad repeat protein
MEVVKNISLIISATISAITLITLIVKPLRIKFANFIKKFTNDVEQDSILKEQAEAIKKEDKDIKELKETVKQIADGLSTLSDKVSELGNRIFKNEADRLRSELFDCGNRCRRGIVLSGEEFRHIQVVFKKYHDELHENSIGEDEYNFIKKYFNSTINQDKLNRKYDD